MEGFHASLFTSVLFRIESSVSTQVCVCVCVFETGVCPVRPCLHEQESDVDVGVFDHIEVSQY